jgi:peptidoglycan/xylan/chitin deacetylase (PgdA/CDA1 family)
MQKLETGLFVLSLDFELLWGVRDKRMIESYGENIRGVRQVIPGLLRLFSQYGIHATFATVGFLFCRNKQELQNYIPKVIPVYGHKKYSPYENNYLDTIGQSEEDDIYHYAASLINLIQQYPEQEIATHTFSHFYCLEGASIAAFEADLLAAKRIAATHGVPLHSIVFPRNQYSNEHIEICKKLGIIAYRGNEKSSIYQPRKNEAQNKWIRATRLLDSYINITGHNTHDLRWQNDGIVNIPASAFLRPYSRKQSLLNPLQLARIKNSLTYAAKNKQVYHLWWHPHNFGVHTSENFALLKQILRHYKHLNETYGFQSKSMKEIAEEIGTAHAR